MSRLVRTLARLLTVLLVVSVVQVTQAALTPASAVAAPLVDVPRLLNGNGARLTWRRATESDFQRYEIHRSTSPGFAASASTKLVEIGYRPLTMFTDTTAKGSTTYYYKVVIVAVSGRAESEVKAVLPATGTSSLTIPAAPETVAGTTIGQEAAQAATPCGDDTSSGAAPRLYVGTDATWIQRALLRFDVREIPADAVVTSANLALTWVPSTTTDTGVRAYRVTQQWSEGSGASSSCSGGAGASWRESQPGVQWRTDSAETSGGTYTGSGIAPNAASPNRTAAGTDTFDLKSVVQAWANGQPNFGVLLRQQTESRATPSLVTYYSDDATETTQRPALTVTWNDPSKTAVPTLSVDATSPAPNQVLSGSTTLGANVSSATGPVTVRYFVDNSQVGAADTDAPFTTTWASSSIPDGTAHTFRAEVTDAAGQVKSSSVPFAVDNSPAPTNVTIQSPAAGSTQSGTVVVTATATDDKAVDEVALTVDGTVVSRDKAAPWSLTWDTKDALVPGYRGKAYTLKVEATDSSGRSTESTVRSIYVDNDTSTTKLYRATFGLNGYGTTTAAFEVPPMVDTIQTTSTALTETTPTGDGNTGTKGLMLSSEPTCDACVSGTTALRSTSTKSGPTLQPQATTVDTQSVIATPAPDDGGSLPTTGGGGGGGGSTTNPKPLADGAFRLDVDVTNTSPVAWKSGGPGGVGLQLWYRWVADDGTVVYEAPGNDYFPNNLKSGAVKTIPVLVRQPPLLGGAERDRLHLRFDIYDSAANVWFADRGNKPMDQPVVVNHALSANLGLERYWQYEQVGTGAGGNALVNVGNGNLLWRYSPWATPGRGIATIVDLTYNSLEEHSDSPAGENVSLNISGLLRFGSRLDIHPNKADTLNGQSNRYVRFIDGDGTMHSFTGALDASGAVVWTEPAGVNLYLTSNPSTTDPKRYWRMTRPDGMTYWFDQDGYPRLVQDKNDNVLEFELVDTEAGQDPGGPKKRVSRIIDAANRAYVVDYYEKDEVKGGRVRGNVQSLTDHSGSKLVFDYYHDGNLRTLTQVGGISPEGVAVKDRTMVFTYTNPRGTAPAITDATARKNPPLNTTQSVKLYSVIDYLGNETSFSYWGSTPDAKNRWKLKSWTDREQNTTTFTHDWANRVMTSDAPLQRDVEYGYDASGRVTRIVNPKEDATTVAWTTDNKVSRVTLPTGKTQRFEYDENGYTTKITNEAGESSLLSYYRRPVDARDTRNHLGFLKTRTLPKGAVTADPDDYTWSFGIDARGNTVTVTDPEGTRTAAGGDYTTAYEYGAPGTALAGLVTAQVKPMGGRSVFEYHASGQVSRITDAVGSVTTYGFDPDSQVVWTQDAEHQSFGGTDTRAFRSYFDFDEFGRVVRRSAPESTQTLRGQLIWSVSKYDANDNVLRELVPVVGTVSGAPDPETAPATVVSYDRMDRSLLITGPDKTVDPQGERTRIAYDAAGRSVSTTRPKGVDTAGQDYAVVTDYDMLDQPVSVSRFGAVGEPARRSFACYDLAGDLVAKVGARAGRTSVDCAALAGARFVTRMEYDAAHRLTKVTDPEGRVSTTSYDTNGAVEQVGRRITRTVPERWHRTSVTYDQRGLAVERRETFSTRPELKTVLKYDQEGRQTLQASPRAVDADAGAGVYADFSSRSEYDLAGRLVRRLLPKEGAGEQQYVHLSYDKLGRLAWQSLPTSEGDPSKVSALAKTQTTYFDPGWVRTLDKNSVPAVLFDYDALGDQTGRVPAKPGTDADWNYDKRVTWTFTPDGQRATQTERDGSTSWWKYDAHNLLVDAKDPSGVSMGWDGAVETKVAYNGFDEATKIRTRKSGEAGWKFAAYTFNEDGQPTVRLENGREDANGVQVDRPRRVELTYDDSGFMTTQLNLGATDACSGDEKIVMSYTDTGWESTRDLWRGGAGCGADPSTWTKRQTTTWDQYDNGLLKQLVTKNGSGALTESHDVSYTTTSGRYEDGNRVVDHYVLKRADGVTASDCTAAAPCDRKFTYDPRGRVLVDQIKADNIVRYTLDEPGMLRGDNTIRAGNVTTTVKLGTTTNQYYAGGQLVESRATNGGVSTTSKYWYDDFGNQDCVTTGTGTQADCNSPRDKAKATVTQEFTYDSLNRMLAQAKYTGGGTATDWSQYVFDALDRVIEETENHVGLDNDRTTDFSFNGLTTQVGQEVQTGGTDARTKTYSYNSQGQRMSMTDQQTGQPDSTQQSYSYAVDVHGSVSQLLSMDGKVKASYGYDAYGNADTSDTGTGSDKSLTTGDIDDQDPLNPYRFTGKRMDSGTAAENQNATSLDMGARRFGLDTGRFLQEDMFMSSLGDLGLSMDPLSQNRYALAGGNPVSNIETDGHMFAADGGGGSTSSGGNSTTSTSSSTTSSSSDDEDESDDDKPWYEDAWDATSDFVSDHKADIGGVAAGIGAGGACVAASSLTAFTTAVACGAVGGAAGSAAHAALDDDDESAGEFAAEVAGGGALGALTGGVGNKVAPFVSKGAGSLFSKLSGGVGSGGSAAARSAMSSELKSSVSAVHSALDDEYAQTMRTTAVIRAQQPGGDVVDVYAGSGTRGLAGKQKDAVKQMGGIAAPNISGDAETTALSYVTGKGWTPLAGAVSRPSCPMCTNALMGSGAQFTGPMGPYRFQGQQTFNQSEFFWFGE